MCALHDLVPPTVWNASLNKWWRLKQSMQLVHMPLSSWHNAVHGTQLGKVCYYSTSILKISIKISKDLGMSEKA